MSARLMKRVGDVCKRHEEEYRERTKTNGEREGEISSTACKTLPSMALFMLAIQHQCASVVSCILLTAFIMNSGYIL